MKIHIESQTVLGSIDAAYHDYRVRTMRAEPVESLDWAAEGYGDYQEPEYDPATFKRGTMAINMGDYWTWEVVARSAEELEAEHAGQLRQIERARRAYLDEQIDPDGIQLAAMLYQAGHPYGAQMFGWFTALGKEMSLRRARLEAGLVEFGPELLDFSTVGDKPVTINQLMIAAGL